MARSRPTVTFAPEDPKPLPALLKPSKILQLSSKIAPDFCKAQKPEVSRAKQVSKLNTIRENSVHGVGDESCGDESCGDDDNIRKLRKTIYQIHQVSIKPWCLSILIIRLR